MEGVAYEEIEHTADWALRVQGEDLAQLFGNAARGMLKLAGVVPDEGAGTRRSFTLQSLDRESLLVDFLEELLVALELRSVAFRDLELEILADQTLRATLVELPVKSIAKQIKAVTYNDLKIETHPRGWVATVVFDV